MADDRLGAGGEMDDGIGRGGDRGAIALICALFGLAVLLVGPGGEFPVTDDWAFIESVRAMTQSGELRLSDWASMNLVSHIVWGSLFGLLFGVDYTILRVSSLVALLVAGVVFFMLMRKVGIDRRIAILATLAMMLNPLTFSLAFSFMTDVPYMAMQIGAMALLASGHAARSRLRITFGWLAAAAALLSRQTGMALPLAAAGEGALRSRWSATRIALAFAPLAAFVALQAAYEHWLKTSGLAPRLYGRQTDDVFGRLFSDPLRTAADGGGALASSLFYLGLLSLPLTVLVAARLGSGLGARLRVRMLAIAAGLLATVILLCQWFGAIFPMWGNTIRVEGIGADFDRFESGAEVTAPAMPDMARQLLTQASAVGALLLVLALGAFLVQRFRRRRDIAEFDIVTFALLTGLVLLGPLVLTELPFDRYLIPILPCLLLAAAAPAAGWQPPRAALVAGWAAIALIASYSIAATHDFMELKRVQWRAYSDLSRRVPTRFIDAGWVLNGQASFGRYGAARYGEPKKMLGWYERADYIVGTKRHFRGYRPIASYPVDLWLTWGKPVLPMLIQQRAAAPANPRR